MERKRYFVGMGKETVNGWVYWVEVFLTIKHFEKKKR